MVPPNLFVLGELIEELPAYPLFTYLLFPFPDRQRNLSSLLRMGTTVVCLRI